MYHIISKVKDKILTRKEIGGKAENLFKLKDKNFNVPDFFVISSDVDDIEYFKEDIQKSYVSLNSSLVAVRSSAVGEDGAKQSFAGQYKTILSVSKKDILQAIKECRDSLNSHHALSYAKNKTVNKMAVIVQKMIFADISGVAFSADPVRNDKNIVVVESVQGSCEQLVSGFTTPEHYTINKNNINTENIPKKIKEVALVTLEIEKEFGYFVDIEWAIQNDILYILQVRPITTINKTKNLL